MYNNNFQIVPPNMKQRNSSERAIRTCKNIFIAVFSTTNPDFPISEWNRLVFQCLITLNIIRNFRVSPDLLACAYLCEPYNFNKSPMAPPGTRVVFHDKPDNHTSWRHNSTPEWYIGPYINHFI